MTTTLDQQFEIQTTGTSDWDTALNSALAVLERGHHVTVTAGRNINTGEIVELASLGGYARQCNGNSASYYQPVGIAYYSASSGQTINIMTRGVLRSLAVLSLAHANPGWPIYVSLNSPGYLGVYDPAAVAIGYGLPNSGFIFRP